MDLVLLKILDVLPFFPFSRDQVKRTFDLIVVALSVAASSLHHF